MLKVSGVKEVRTLFSLTGMLVGIGTVPFMLWFSDFHVQNLLTLLINCMGQSPLRSKSFLNCSKISQL